MNQSDDDYWNKTLPQISVEHGPDTFSIDKSSGDDWAHFVYECNGDIKARITIRSRELAAGLRFMLDQLLRGSE